jgi:hypothetical protein
MPAYTVGTKNRVDTVANSRPPITARPSGAFCSAPSPRPSAIGIMPMIIASAVISTGRMRVAPASSAADSGGTPAASRSRAKDTSRMLLAVATPMVMIAPVSAGTLSVVPVRNSIQAMPASAAGSAVMMIAASSQDWKVTTISRYTSTTAIASPMPSPRKEDCMVSTWPRIVTWLPRESLGRISSTSFLTSFATLARSVPCTLTYTSTTGAML